MRVVLVVVIVMAKQHVFRQRLGDGHDIPPFGQIAHEVFHLRFEVKAVPQNEIGARYRRDICARLPIGMRIDAGAHECLHLNEIAADLADGIRDHAGRRDDIEPRFGMRRRLCNGKRDGKSHGRCGGEKPSAVHA